MGWDIYIEDKDGKTIVLDEPHQIAGGTYALGGTPELWLSLTYNYAEYYFFVLDTKHEDGGRGGLRGLDGLTVEQALPILEDGIAKLQGEPAEDYWAKTEGNARAGLIMVRDLVKLAPPGSKMRIS